MKVEQAGMHVSRPLACGSHASVRCRSVVRAPLVTTGALSRRVSDLLNRFDQGSPLRTVVWVGWRDQNNRHLPQCINREVLLRHCDDRHSSLPAPPIFRGRRERSAV